MIKKMLFAELLFLDTTAPSQQCSALQLKQRRTPINCPKDHQSHDAPVLHCLSYASHRSHRQFGQKGLVEDVWSPRQDHGFLKSINFEREWLPFSARTFPSGTAKRRSRGAERRRRRTGDSSSGSQARDVQVRHNQGHWQPRCLTFSHGWRLGLFCKSWNLPSTAHHQLIDFSFLRDTCGSRADTWPRKLLNTPVGRMHRVKYKMKGSLCRMWIQRWDLLWGFLAWPYWAAQLTLEHSCSTAPRTALTHPPPLGHWMQSWI